MAQRILIIKPSALGDVATTLPLLCDLKAAMPDASIDWLIHPAYAPVIQGHDALHQWIAFDRKNLASWWYKPSSTKRFSGLLKTLRDNRYDVVIDAQGLFRSGFLTRITGAKKRIGFAHAREGAALAYTDKVALPDRGKKMLAVDRMRALGQALGTNLPRPPEFRMPISLAAKESANKFQEPPGFAAVIPGARWNTKRWPAERYAEIVRRLLDDGTHVVLIGSPDEKPLCDEVQTRVLNLKSEISNFQSEISNCNSGKSNLKSQISNLKLQLSNLVNLAGQTDIPTMIALLSRARLVIGNDSGPLHVAAALGRPVVALYGPTPPDFVGPFGQMQNVLRHDVPCHPCRRRECDHHSCMKGLTVELVWEKTRGAH